jgi:unsaturated rhamnogalacturonyl hydrolase
VSDRIVRDRLALVADSLTRYPFVVWHYGDSIGLEGLLAATDVLRQSSYEAWVHGLIKGWLPRAKPYREIDNTAPGHAILQAFERIDDLPLLDAATELADYLRTRRSLEGAYVSFERTPLRPPHGGAVLPTAEQELLAEPGAGVFVDCLHFDPPFFAHLATIRADDELLDLAADQAAAYIELLQHPDGLFSHFWLEQTARSYGYGWGRGQGWALLGLGDVLERLPATHQRYERILTAYRALAEALARTQHPHGGWSTVVSEPEWPVETSVGAFAAAGFAQGIALGLLDESYAAAAQNAWTHAASAIDETGKVTGVSAAVWPSTGCSHYREVPTGYLVPWGQGPLLLAAKRLRDLDPSAEPAPRRR